MLTHVHGSIFIRAKRWKPPKCPWTDERRNKMWSMHTMEYYAAMKRSEPRPVAKTKVDPAHTGSVREADTEHSVGGSIYRRPPAALLFMAAY